MVEQSLALEAAERRGMAVVHARVLVQMERRDALPFDVIADAHCRQERVLRDGGREHHRGLACPSDLGADHLGGDRRARGAGLFTRGVDSHFKS
jgi:hypothetical protein